MFRFNHAKHRWGKNFSTVEIGKTRLRKSFRRHRDLRYSSLRVGRRRGFARALGYKKTSVKSAEKFSAHCSDSLSLAVNITTGRYIEPGAFVVVDDRYRPKRRRLHDTQPAKGRSSGSLLAWDCFRSSQGLAGWHGERQSGAALRREPRRVSVLRRARQARHNENRFVDFDKF